MSLLNLCRLNETEFNASIVGMLGFVKSLLNKYDNVYINSMNHTPDGKCLMTISSDTNFTEFYEDIYRRFNVGKRSLSFSDSSSDVSMERIGNMCCITMR